VVGRRDLRVALPGVQPGGGGRRQQGVAGSREGSRRPLAPGRRRKSRRSRNRRTAAPPSRPKPEKSADFRRRRLHAQEMAKRKILITGAGGMLGHELIQFAPASVEIIPLPHAKLDVTDYRAVDAACAELQPDQIIHAAAMTDVDGCEKDPDRAYRVNGVAARNVAAAASRHDAEV